jgi:serine/threonine-protein kinase RsbT
MDEPSASQRLMGALTPYFSHATAEALFSVSLRRASVGPRELGHASLPAVVSVLERALPAYLADQARRAECVQGLRRLVEQSGRAMSRANGEQRPANGHSHVAPATIQIRRPEDVSNVCDSGREVARRVGFSLVEQTKIATAISELARNILCYASTGSMTIDPVETPRRGVAVLAIDRGPGIADVPAVMSVRYRSRTGMGMGLKGVKRLMDEFEIWSKPGVGTTVTTRKFLP